jgi:DNA invertase Pin-like site-specific DNA recombinase
MNPGAVVIGYARKSKAEIGNGHGLDSQEQTIRAECKRRGWTLLECVRDDGASGRDTDRAGLTLALEAIARGDAAGLIVAKLDRLSRSVVDFGQILEWIDAADATLVALDLNVDTSTPGGRLVANVFASVAQWERETIGQRTRDGLAERRRVGKTIGHPAFVDNAENVKLRERIRRMHKRGMSYGQIASKLTTDRVAPLRGGKAWSRASVQSACRTEPRKATRRKPASLPAL